MKSRGLSRTLLGDPGARIFVYGTLLSGCEMAGLLASFRREPARVRGLLYSLPAGYPALVADHEASWVEGELVYLDAPRSLVLVDQYEGVGRGLYERVVLPVAHDGRSSAAWAYVMNAAAVRRARGRRLPGGSWLRFRHPQGV